MSHLSRDERLLALDGALDATREAHLAACAACRTEVEALRTVLARVRAVDVPEPSPLFWDHLAARVGDAIAREPAPAATRAWWSPRLAWVAIAVLVTAAGTGYVMRPRATAAVPVVAATSVEPAAATAAPTGVPDLSMFDIEASPTDDGWALIAAVADEGGSDEEVLAPQAGQAELSISMLTPEERLTLARELAAELAPGRIREG
jgi:hypothetical protein